MAEDDLTALYKRYAPALHRRCASIVSNHDEARDLVQETFARYLAVRDQWRDRASPFAVLYRIAVNASIDRVRRRRTVAQGGLDAAAVDGAAHADRPDRFDSLHDLAVLSRGLSEEELTVAVLHHLDGYTQDGIAAALDLSRRTVGKILARFEDHIRKRAARMGYPMAVRSVGDG
ncbi:MAG TPA: sigma-70 family RNA polymerase sigma factor [Kofleriaceae bacterium]|nr:sigma-70 family RNA polymerase sigma factor [Kofleriaceae bacterium]